MPWPRRGVARQRMNGSLRLRYRHGMGMIAAPWMRASPEALDTPDQVVTCRAVCTVPLAGATCPSWERPLASREACQGPGDRRKLSPPEARRAAKPRSRARITRGED